MSTLPKPRRENDLPRVVTFDDQLWPVNVALAILAGFTAGALIAIGRFDDPRPLANVWTHLGLLAVATLLVMWCASKINRRRVRRGLQLAMLVSLVLHLLFIVVLNNQRWNLFAEQRTPIVREYVPPEVFVAPDHAFWTSGDAADEQIEPVPAIAPDADSLKFARPESQLLAALPLESQPTPNPSVVPELPPSGVEPRDRDEAAPQLALRSLPLSKQAPREPQLAKSVAEPLAQLDQSPEAPPVQPQFLPPANPLQAPAAVSEASRPAPSMVPTDASDRIAATGLTPRPAERLDTPEGRLAPPRVPAMPRLAARVNRPSIATSVPPLAETEPSTAEIKVAPSPAPMALDTSPARRQLALELPVPRAVPDGPGIERTPGGGSLSRRAQEDSELAHAGAERLLNRRSPKAPAVDGRSREPAEAFVRRGGQRQNKRGGDESSQRSEAAIELGLDFLARHQAADGSWKLNFAGPRRPGSEERASFRSDSAATGLALLSFLGAGYDHFGGPYQGVVQLAWDSLLKRLIANGDLYLPMDAASNNSAWLYSHGIASIALCEAYGMTGDRALAGPAQRAINFIVASQDPKRGAWRYTPGSGSDTSVSGWQLMALKSGDLAGLDVPPDAYQKVKLWLDGAQVAGSQFVYNPLAPDTSEQRHGRRPTSSMTAVGLLMRLYTGWNRNDPRMIEGAEHLLRKLPEQGSATQPARDTYYWYYATQVMFHMRGTYWRAWNERLHPLLIDEQVQSGPLAGSWDPLKPVPDRWGSQGGRIYVTTLNLLSLEVNYRHLPIYESTLK